MEVDRVADMEGDLVVDMVAVKGLVDGNPNVPVDWKLMEVMVTYMELDMVINMEVDTVADTEIDKVVDNGVNVVADTEVDKWLS